MARNKQNLKQQLITRLENQRAYGQKKEKEQRGVENYNSGRAVRGIHSYASMRTYKSSVATFADWMKTAHAEVRSVNDITEFHVRKYMWSLQTLKTKTSERYVIMSTYTKELLIATEKSKISLRRLLARGYIPTLSLHPRSAITTAGALRTRS